MAEKKQRMRSALSGLSAVAPRQEETVSPPGVSDGAPVEAVAVVQAGGKRKKLACYVSEGDEQRIRAAFIAARNAGKPFKSLSDFQVSAVLVLTAQMEAELNGGQPFDGVGTGVLSPGRPLSS